MKVMMLDKSPYVDRRITQMSHTLQEMGHTVRLFAAPSLHGEDAWLNEPLSVELVPRDVPTERLSRFGQWRKSRIHALRARLQPPAPRQPLALLELFLLDPDYALSALPYARAPTAVKDVAAVCFSAWRALFGLGPQRLLPSRYGVVDWWDANLAEAAAAFGPDVVHANDFPSLKAALLVQRRLGCPIVYDSHELYSHQPGFTGDLAEQIRRQERALCQHVRAIIVINSQQAAIMGAYLGYDRFVPCTNAINPPAGFDVRVRDPRLKAAIGVAPDTPVILFQGAINRLRKIDQLMEGFAAASRKDLHLAFLTSGREIPEFQDLAAHLGVRDRVHFLPYVPWNEVVYWASGADCGMMPYQALDRNTTISSPNKMYEFLVAGTPMIGSSELENVARIVGGYGLGVVRRLREPADYTAAIDEFFDEAKGGSNRFRPALIAHSSAFSWDSEVEGVRQLYREIVAEIPTRSR